MRLDRISASVVLYKTNLNLLRKIISSYCPSESRILFLIDNSPEQLDDNLIDSFGENVRYYYNNRNLGYGSAHNIALRKAITEEFNYHIVMNPDISFNTDVLDKLIGYAEENKDVVYILPKVVYPNGDLQYLCKLLPTPFDLFFRRFLSKSVLTHKKNYKYTLRESGYNSIINPPCLSGCFMFLRISELKINNILFDEQFFMYCEDFDLIRRLHRIGKTIYFPEVSIVHDHARDSYKNNKMLFEHLRSAFKYFNKYGWLKDKERFIMNNKILTEIKGK